MEKPILAAMLSVGGTELSDKEKLLLEKGNPLGITLFGKNIKSKKQIKKLISEIKSVIGRDDVLIAVDQEGGRVRRLIEPEFRSYAAQIELGRLEYELDEKTAEKAIVYHTKLISQDLIETGFNWNYAPVLDVAYPTTSAALKSRCFGKNEKRISKYGKLMIDEYQNQGICPCIKHLPGHGRANIDPHLGLPIINSNLKELEKDFYPFITNNNAPAGMTAHIKIPAIDEVFPITQSAKGIDVIIRGIIGFKGFLISDSINMQALSGTIIERAQQSINAGCDAVCYCMGQESELEQLVDWGQVLSDDAMNRFTKIKNIIKKKKTLNNLDKLANDYQSIIGKIEKYNDNYDATEVLRQMKEIKN